MSQADMGNEPFQLANYWQKEWFGPVSVCIFEKFHLTFNLKSKVSRDVFMNKSEFQLTSTFYSSMLS